MSKVKQIIIIRKDLMNPIEEYAGKMIAQGGHGVAGALLQLFNNGKSLLEETPPIVNGKYNLSLDVEVGSDLDNWFRGIFTKVCVYVNSEEKLLNIYNEAKASGLNTVLITDNGITKFNGIKTNTCVTIGPDDSEKIDQITKRLRLL